MPYRLRDLFKVTDNVSNLINWLLQLDLLLNLSGIACVFCGKGSFYLRKDSSFSKDSCCWRCSKLCNKKVSLRHGSWFSNLTLENVVLLTYLWVYRVEQEFVQHELSLSQTTIVDWYNFAREVCLNILENKSQKVGGIGKTVEIDESKFGKRKYHRGRRIDGVWVFGGIERESKKCFFKCVENRTADTLVEIIKEFILPGTTIISDCWKAYCSLSKEGYKHLTVNHSVNFVDPDSGAHTNTIESTWRALKKSLPRHGTTKTLYDSYFSQYSIRKQYLKDSEDPFLEFLQLIRTVYTPTYSPTAEEIEKFKSSRMKEAVKPEAKKRSLCLPLTDISNTSLDDFQL